MDTQNNTSKTKHTLKQIFVQKTQIYITLRLCNFKQKTVVHVKKSTAFGWQPSSGLNLKRRKQMIFRPISLFLFAVTLLTSSACFSIAPREALLIGNTKYPPPHSTLKNPINDVNDLEAALKKVGFHVTKEVNLDADEMQKALQRFTKKLSENPETVGLFYFSGHGVQVSHGRHFILPIGRPFQSEKDFSAHAFEDQTIMAKMNSARNDLNILILDACRSLGIAEATSRGLQDIEKGRGLGRTDTQPGDTSTTGSIISHATGPGTTVDDLPDHPNSLYARHLKKAITTPGLSLEDVFKQVRGRVEQDSKGILGANKIQSPVEVNKLKLGQSFYFLPPSARQPGTTTTRTKEDIDKYPAPIPGANSEFQPAR
jgi:uncharacterized caspase-like protein